MTNTVDDMMEEFISDMNFADYEISDSIFNCVDNYIDSLCIEMMQSEDNIFESDRNDSRVPFVYIIDKVLDKVDTIINISSDSIRIPPELAKDLGIEDDEFCNKMDPDYCDDIDFTEISPEEFQLYIPNVDRNTYPEDDEDTVNINDSYDSIFNA